MGSFRIVWASFGIFWYLLVSFGFFWFLLVSFGFFWFLNYRLLWLALPVLVEHVDCQGVDASGRPLVHHLPV